MSEYKLVQGCTVDDGEGLANCNMRAFWQEPSWRIMWNHRTLEDHVAQNVKRYPQNLLTERSVRRHVKIVHVPTGQIAAYSRWIVPESHQDAWLEAQVPDVSDEEKARIKEVFDTTAFNPRQGLEAISDSHYKVWQETYGPHGPHIVLAYLCCHPDHQRKGLASQLVAAGIAKSDELKLPISCYAVTTAATGMYEKSGFKRFDEKHTNLPPGEEEGTYDTYYLIKEPGVVN